ncbi:cystatin family protein [Yersinia pestis]|nr:cystatin family protein [Yersinia pestis]MDL1310930.1 cystatin family protein [Yersinia pestis]MDL1373607.1 cystatin family protein [Yersinia pestis]
MGLLQLLVLCVLATCCGAVSPPGEIFKPALLLSRGCNDSDVLSMARLALQDINNQRKDGYVLTLNRVKDVWEHRQEELGSLFYLTMDVLETDCHVLSKKTWKDCGERILHESVYGQCKAMFFINKPRRILYLPAYNCTLRPVSRRKIHSMCPDCPSPTSIDLSDPRLLEATTESLAKYNRENTSKQYSLVKVTRALFQWVFGPFYFVEYLIKESPCTKSQAGSCSLQSSDSVPVGLCKGSLAQRELQKHVSVTCELFTSQVQAPGGENSTAKKGPDSLPKVEEPPKRNAVSSGSSYRTTATSIQYLPDLDDEKPEDSQSSDPQEAFPVELDLTTNPQGDTLDVSFLFIGPEEKKLVVFPFPKEKQHSDECPGPAQNANPLVLPP